MSVWDIKVTIYIVMAIGFCVAMYPRLLQDEMSRNVIIAWVVLLPFITILRLPIITVVAICLVLLYVQRKVTIYQRLFLFIALCAAVPLWFDFEIGAGGSVLFQVRYWKLLVLILLLPALLKLLGSDFKIDFVDILFFLLVIYVFVFLVLFDKSVSPIVAVRNGLDYLLYHLVVYLVFSRAVIRQPREAMLHISYGFFILALILSGVFLFNQVFNVDLYQIHSTFTNVYNEGFKVEYRGGFLRTEGPLAGEVMGLVIGAAVLSLYLIKERLKITFLRFLFLASLFLLVCITTGSRGVLFTFLLITMIFTYLHFGAGLRLGAASRIVVFLLACFAFAIYSAVFSGGPPVQDEFGTFDFRAQLWEAARKFIAEHPYGDSVFESHYYFDHMRRGPTKFLDVVSVYLQYWLPTGYPGLILYILPFAVTIIQLVKLSFSGVKSVGAFADPFKMYLGLMIGYMFMISTVSDVGLIAMFGVIFLAVSRGLIHAHRSAAKNVDH